MEIKWLFESSGGSRKHFWQRKFEICKNLIVLSSPPPEYLDNFCVLVVVIEWVDKGEILEIFDLYCYFLTDVKNENTFQNVLLNIFSCMTIFGEFLEFIKILSNFFLRKGWKSSIQD